MNHSGILLGQNSGYTINGILSLTNLVIGSQGNYSFVSTTNETSIFPLTLVQVNETYEITEEILHIPENLQMPTFLNISTDTIDPAIYSDVLITIIITDQLGDPYLNICEVNITGSSHLYGSTHDLINNSQAILRVYSKTPGNLTVNVSACNNLSASLNLTAYRLAHIVNVSPYIVFFI